MAGEGRLSLIFLGITILCTVLSLVSLILHGIAFNVPNWLESNPAAGSKFVQIGLSVVCFDKFQTEKDNFAKLYDGCYHINSAYVEKIRGWLVPAWFQKCFDEGASTIALQVFAFIALVVCCVVEGRRMYMDPHPKTNQRQDRLTLILAFSSAILLLISGGLLMDLRQTFIDHCFGTRWMPNPELNVLGAGYNMERSALILVFFCSALAVGAGVLKCTFVMFAKKTQPEQRFQMFSVAQMANMAGGDEDGATGGVPVNADELPEKSGVLDQSEYDDDDDEEYDDDDDHHHLHDDYHHGDGRRHGDGRHGDGGQQYDREPRGRSYQPQHNSRYPNQAGMSPAYPQQGQAASAPYPAYGQASGAPYNPQSQQSSAPYPAYGQAAPSNQYRGGYGGDTPEKYDRGYGGSPYANDGRNYGYDSSAPTSPVRPTMKTQPMMRPIERNVDMPPYEDSRYGPSSSSQV